MLPLAIALFIKAFRNTSITIRIKTLQRSMRYLQELQPLLETLPLQ